MKVDCCCCNWNSVAGFKQEADEVLCLHLGTWSFRNTAINSDHSNITDKHGYVYYRIKRVHRWGDTVTAMPKALSREKPGVGPQSYWNEVFKGLPIAPLLRLNCGGAPQPKAVTLPGGEVVTVHCSF